MKPKLSVVHREYQESMEHVLKLARGVVEDNGESGIERVMSLFIAQHSAHYAYAALATAQMDKLLERIQRLERRVFTVERQASSSKRAQPMPIP